MDSFKIIRNKSTEINAKDKLGKKNTTNQQLRLRICSVLTHKDVDVNEVTTL